MKKTLKKAVRESFNFPEPARKAEFLEKYGEPPVVEKRRARFAPIALRIASAAAVCALAVGLWSIGKSPAVDRETPDESGIVSEIEATKPLAEISTRAATTEAAETVRTESGTIVTVSATATVPNESATVTSAAEKPSEETARKETAPARTTKAVSGNGGTPASTTVANSHSNIRPLTEEERSIIMKKLASFLAGVTFASSITIPNASASYVWDLDTTRYSQYAAYIKQIEDGELDVDFNMDGKFDETDCRIHYWYTCKVEEDGEEYQTNLEITPEIVKNASKKSDLNGDGEIGYDDRQILLYYLILHNPVSYDYCYATYYDPDYVPLYETGPIDDDLFYNPVSQRITNVTLECVFANMYFRDTNTLLAGYPALEELADRGGIDLDANADGKIDARDYLDFVLFEIEIESGSCHFDSEESLLPEDEWNRVYEAHKNIPYYDDRNTYWALRRYMAAYFASHIDVQPEYYENDYYDTLLPGSGYWSVGDMFETGAMDMGVIPNKWAAFRIDDNIFKAAFCDYYIAVKEGRMAEPDVNMDGVVDDNDVKAMDIYLYDKFQYDKTAAESELDEKVWNNIAENGDLSGNGTCGDIYDWLIATYYNDLQDDERPVYVYGEEATAFKAGLGLGDGWTILADADIERSGDLNDNGKLDMGDAVTILQAYSNPDKYQLTSKQRFNADVYDTGDGVTPMDALGVQKKLLGLE